MSYMDENPYKAPVERSGSNQKNSQSHPMLDPLWNGAARAILLLPFLIGIAAALILSILG